MNTSQITFLYFQDLEAAKHFFEGVLCLEKAYDPGWAVVYRTAGQAFVGAVDAKHGSIEVPVRGGVLISITVDDLEPWYTKLSSLDLEGFTQVKDFEDLGLKSFFFKGPEGYDFEIQSFYNPTLKELF